MLTGMGYTREEDRHLQTRTYRSAVPAGGFAVDLTQFVGTMDTDHCVANARAEE